MSHDISDFEQDVVERSKTVPVLVDFWAPWCGPCKMLGPVLDKLEAEAGGRWVLAKVNTDQHQELAMRHGIRGIPDVRLFHRGSEVGRFTGALPESQVRRWLAEQLPTPKREAIAKAREHLRSGHSRHALKLLEPLASADPADTELASLSARAEVFSNPAGALARLAQLPKSHPWEENAMIVNEFGRLLTTAGTLPSSPERDLYLTAVDALRAEDFETAGRRLIDVLLEKPGYDDGHAKAACLALFKHIGLRHPVSEKLSRSFSMAVNV